MPITVMILYSSYNVVKLFLLLATVTGSSKAPDSFILEYSGQDETVRDILAREKVEGEYVNQKSVQNGSPYYLKEKPVWLYLSRNTQGWHVSQFLMSERYIMLQKGANNYLPSENSPWTFKSGRIAQGIILRPIVWDKADRTEHPIEEDDSTEHPIESIGEVVEEDEFENITNTTQENDDKSQSNATLLILAVSLSVVLLSLLSISLSRGLAKRKEEPEMEENEDYGEEEEYYDEHNNRIVDNNDYYQ